MKKFKLLFLSVCFALVLAGPAQGAWTINSVAVAGGGSFFDYQLIDITVSLSSDGAAETAIDIWAQIISTGTDAQQRMLKRGGLFYTLYYEQGTDAPDNDFLLTFFDGNGKMIFNETIDYDEAGAGSVVGGSYGGNTTRGQYLPLKGGLTANVADIGGSGDDILLIITIVRPYDK